MRHLPCLRATVQRGLRIAARLAAHPGLPASRAQILAHDFQARRVSLGLGIVAGIALRIGGVPDIARMIRAEHRHIQPFAWTDACQTQYANCRPILFLDPVAHRRPERNHRQRRAAGGLAELLDQRGLVILEVVVDVLQIPAGIGRRGDRRDVDDGLISRRLPGGDAVIGQQSRPAVGSVRAQIILRLGQRVIGREVQQLDAFTIFQGHAQRQEQIPAIGPFAIGIELAGAGISQVAGVEQR